MREVFLKRICKYNRTNSLITVENIQTVNPVRRKELLTVSFRLFFSALVPYSGVITLSTSTLKLSLIFSLQILD